MNQNMTVLHEIYLLRKNTKGMLFITAFRMSSFFTQSVFLKAIGFPIRFLYRLIIQWILGIDISDLTQIGKNLNIYHGQGLVINSSTIIGDNVTIRQNTTIGNARENGNCPIIGNNVNVGANSVIIGDITIGENSIIAAGSIVIRDVPNNVVVAGNPAIIVKEIQSL